MTRKRVVRVTWTGIAEEDLTAIVEYLAQDNPDAALTVFDRIRSAAEELVTFPERGRIVPELYKYGISQYRELLPTPWRIIYRAGEDVAIIMAVIDGRRDQEDILLERIGRV